MKKTINSSRLGSFSNDGLGSGLGFSEWSEEDLKKAQDYIAVIHKKIKEVFDKEIFRIDVFLKNKLGIIPKSNDFAIWYFDNLPIKKQNQFIEITDEEIIKYTRIYLIELEKLHIENSKKNIENLKSFNWISEINKLENLHIQLIKKEYVSSKTTFTDFEYIFSNNDLNTIANKVIWLKNSRNRMLNKKSISDLIIVLQESNLIGEVQDNIPKILSNCFKSEITDLIFTHSNLANSNGYSEYRTELERIIKSL